MQSLRVERDVRAMVWHDGQLCVLLYVDHHQPAYRWAVSAKVNVTSLANCVAVAVAMDSSPDADPQAPWLGEWSARPSGEPGLFHFLSTPQLRAAGVPEILLPVVRSICDDAAPDELRPALNAELCDRLETLYLADGEGDVSRRAETTAGPQTSSEPEGTLHPSDGEAGLPPGSTQALALRDIDPDDFQRMLENPTEWWVAFADTVQRKIAEGTCSGAVLVTGGAGTGKTIVAMHRARNLARKGRRVLLTSYSAALCESMEHDITLLCNERELKQICVANVDKIAREICPDDQTAIQMPGESDYSRRIRRAAEFMARKGNKSPYDAVIADETQDLDVRRLALLRGLAGKGRDSLTLLGDTNQRIYGEPLDLEDLGISVEGRTFVLAAGYRTTREIAEFGQRILADQGGDAPDTPRSLDTPASGVPGPRPMMVKLSSLGEEAVTVAMAILQRGVPPERMAVFARRRKRLGGIERALKALGVPCMDMEPGTWAPRVGVRLMTMHQARGLEFRVVYVVGASDAELPDPTAVEKAETDAKGRSNLQIERSLLHISATRATHELRVSWVGRPTAYLQGCPDVAERTSGFDVAQYLGVELDTATLEEDPAGFRIAGLNYVAGGRHIARTLSAYLEGQEDEWSSR